MDKPTDFLRTLIHDFRQFKAQVPLPENSHLEWNQRLKMAMVYLDALDQTVEADIPSGEIYDADRHQP